MKSNCVDCGKELESNGFCCPTICDDCYKKRINNIGTDINFRPVMQMQYNGEIYEQGWVCPKCGAVMSPRERSCINCTGNKNTQFTCGTGEYVNTNISQSISSQGDKYNV